jgi:D-3-phosphoglycerate dehydrogenase
MFYLGNILPFFCIFVIYCLGTFGVLENIMNIKLIEPLNISENKIYELSAGFEKAGHNFTYYPTLSKNIAEQKQRTADADILMIANNPLPDEVIRSAKVLKMISVAFTTLALPLAKKTTLRFQMLLVIATTRSQNLCWV